MPDLKLIALDAEDLNVVSAHLQDAVLRVGDMVFLPNEKRFAAILNRFDWEKSLPRGGKAGEEEGKRLRSQSKYERRRTGFRMERVMAAKVHGIDLRDRKATLALLAITFDPAGDPEIPGGDVTLTFSGGAAIRLSVECLELEMRDLGAVWGTTTVPAHPDDES